MPAADLERVERAARKAASARVALEVEMVQAAENGASLRDIAKAADVSHETVRKLVRFVQTGR